MAVIRLRITGLSVQFHRCFGLRGSTLRLLENTHCQLFVIVTHEEFEFHLYFSGILSAGYTFLFIFCFHSSQLLRICFTSAFVPPASPCHPTSFHGTASTLLDMEGLPLAMLKPPLGCLACVCALGGVLQSSG